MNEKIGYRPDKVPALFGIVFSSKMSTGISSQCTHQCLVLTCAEPYLLQGADL